MAASADVQGESGIIDMATLPLETRCPPFRLRQYGGFWLPEHYFPNMEATNRRFEPRPSDVFLASFPKSGTTWLKALAFTTINRAKHPPTSEAHPLRHCGPHDCVPFFEITNAEDSGGTGDAFAALPSPRLLSTHYPYSLLPKCVTADSSGCRVVYICRNPKDTLVSAWLFTQKTMAATTGPSMGSVTQLPPPVPYTIEEALELFCEGLCINGPQWRHVLEYWEESQRQPEKVLFVHYEEMLREPARNVRKLAEFMGCPFSGDEEAAGLVDDIVNLCSFDHISGLEVNKSGTRNFRNLSISNNVYFRKGVVGDWSNHMSPEMAAKLDKVAEDALRGTGFAFAAIGDSA